MTIHKDAFWNCNTQCFFGVCVARLGDVVQYLVSDESAEGFSSSYYIHNGFKSILKQPNVFKPCEFSFSTVVTPKYTSWKSGKIKVWLLQSTKIFSNPLCILLLWLSLSWDFLRLVDGIQFRHTHILLLLASEYHILSNDDNRDFIGCMCNSSSYFFPISKVYFKLPLSFEWFLGSLFSHSFNCTHKWNMSVQQTKTTYRWLCSKPF